LNLYGIGASTDPWTLIWTTALEIAPIVFVICATVDLIRTGITDSCNKKNSNESLLNETSTKKHVNGDDIWYVHSLKLGFKFFCGVICWTIGWEIFNIYYEDPYRGDDLVLRSIGAGIGEWIGLFFACLII